MYVRQEPRPCSTEWAILLPSAEMIPTHNCLPTSAPVGPSLSSATVVASRAASQRGYRGSCVHKYQAKGEGKRINKHMRDNKEQRRSTLEGQSKFTRASNSSVRFPTPSPRFAMCNRPMCSPRHSEL